jgi:ribonuclease inhibitor
VTFAAASPIALSASGDASSTTRSAVSGGPINIIHSRLQFRLSHGSDVKLIIDGSKISSEDDFHEAIATGFALPSWYGRNLDALWDALTGMVDRPVELVWIHAERSRKELPGYEKIVSLLRDVEEMDRQSGRKEAFVLRIQQH